MKKNFFVLILSICTFLFVSHLFAADKNILYTAWLGENETFIAWYAKEKGLDKKAGFDLKMMPFESGKTILESLSPLNWSIAGCGVVPVLSLPLGEEVEIIAVGSDESKSNAIYVRPQSPILKTKGHNPDFPDVYGSPETIKKITILCPLKSSAHYLVENWLRLFNLSSKEVNIKHMEHSQALSAFTGGEGDAVALWAPLTYEAKQKGLKEVANSQATKTPLYTILVANKKFAQKNPQKITAFLDMYLKTIAKLKILPEDELIKEYIRFYKEWSGKTLNYETAKEDLYHHKNFALQEQIELFNPKNKKGLQRVLEKIAIFTSNFNINETQKIILPQTNETYLKNISKN